MYYEIISFFRITLDIPERHDGRKSESDSEAEVSVLSRLPSPLERRQGSLVGDPFLPVPTGFTDNDGAVGGAAPANHDDDEAFSGDAPSPLPSIRLTPSPTPPVTSSEAALRSMQRQE